MTTTCPACRGDGYVEIGDVGGGEDGPAYAAASPCPLAAYVLDPWGYKHFELPGGCEDGQLSWPLTAEVECEMDGRDIKTCCAYDVCDCAPLDEPNEDPSNEIDYWEQGGTFAYEAEQARRRG